MMINYIIMFPVTKAADIIWLGLFRAGRSAGRAGMVCRLLKKAGKSEAEQPSTIFHAGENCAPLRETGQDSLTSEQKQYKLNLCHR